MARPDTVLIVGASGLVGTAAANSFVAADWPVITCSRRQPKLVTGKVKHVGLDLRDTAACERAVMGLKDVTHIVYAAVSEVPGLIPGWSDPNQIKANGQMLENLIEPLTRYARLEHVTILQGTKAYGAAVRPMRVPARERHGRVDHPNFYWLHEDYIRQKADQAGFGFTIFRPQLVVGPNHGVVMNLPPVIGAYAAIRHYEGLPFSFPGGVDRVWEAVDVRLVGDACRWAAMTKSAHGDTFNLTNGEVFSFRDMWPALAAVLGVTPGPDESISLAEYLPARAGLWSEIVARYGLEPVSILDLLGESHHYADRCFAYGTTSPAPPMFVSTVKIKRAGFTDVYDSEQSFCHWLGDLIARKVIPRLGT